MGNIQDSNQASKNISFHFLPASWYQVPYGDAKSYVLTMTLKNLLTQLSTQRLLRIVRDILGGVPESSHKSRGVWVSCQPCPSLSLMPRIINGASHPSGPPSVGSPKEKPPCYDWFGFPQVTQNLHEGCNSPHNG